MADFFILFALATSALSTCAEESQEPLTIVAFGDSTTAVRQTVQQVYADRLPPLLAAHGVVAKVVNAGVGGSHTGRLKDNARHRRAHALDRLDEAVRAHKPDIVVVQFGWNDSWVDSEDENGPSRIPVKDYTRNLKQIVQTLVSDGSRVVLMTPNRPNSSIESWRLARTEQYVDAVRRVAKEHSTALVDVWREYESYESKDNRSSDDLLLDTVHPNDAGHELVANLLADRIGEVIHPVRPNIVLVVADDLGYSDLGCYGSEIRTPHLDRLAGHGLRFSQFYNATRCCPSRACLLTGRYPHQAGMGHMPYDAGEPGYRGDLRTDVPTIAEILNRAGYFTAMTGKWHVTRHTGPDSRRDNWPVQRGFDEFFGTLPGHGSFWDPAGLMRNNRPLEPAKDFFYTNAIAEHAVEFIEQARDRPLFLYVPFTAPHYPLHAREEAIASYEGVYDVGWDAIRSRRHAALIERGLLPEQTRLSPRDPASVPWDDEPNQNWQAHRMQVYAAMITEMDVAIGRIVDQLERSGKLKNTLLVFVSDNGGSNEGHLNNTIERMKKPWTSSVIPDTTPDGRPVRPGDWPGVKLGGPSTYGSYGPRWANVSNTPFRRHKSWTHEGGISTPCIMHWPAAIEDGRTTNVLGHFIDLMPTFAAAAGIDGLQTEGINLLPLLNDDHDLAAFGGREIGWEHEGNRAYRKGKWKIVSEYPGTWATMYPYTNNGQWELYDIEDDRTELNDLAEKEPEALKEMVASYNSWAKRIGVVPWNTLSGKQE